MKTLIAMQLAALKQYHRFLANKSNGGIQKKRKLNNRSVTPNYANGEGMSMGNIMGLPRLKRRTGNNAVTRNLRARYHM